MENIEIIDRPEVQKSQQLITVVENNANKVVITNDVQAAKAGAVLAQIKTLEKELESQRTFFTKPLNDQVKKINELFKGFSAPLAKARALVTGKIIEYTTEQEKIAAEAQRKADIETRRVQNQLNKQAEKEGTEAPIVEAPIVAPVANKIGNSSIVKRWTFKITKESLIPREYLMIDEKKVREAIRSGERNIKGLEIFQESSLSTRTK